MYVCTNGTCRTFAPSDVAKCPFPCSFFVPNQQPWQLPGLVAWSAQREYKGKLYTPSVTLCQGWQSGSSLTPAPYEKAQASDVICKRAARPSSGLNKKGCRVGRAYLVAEWLQHTPSGRHAVCDAEYGQLDAVWPPSNCVLSFLSAVRESMHPSRVHQR